MGAAEMDELERTVMKNGFAIDRLKDGLERNEANVLDIRKDLEDLEKSHYAVRDMVKEIVIASKATQAQAKDIANKAITVKQFYLGVGVLIVAILSLALAVLGVKG
jgi:hypothetical protein